MRNVTNPIWIFIVNTLPISVLIILFYSKFNIIKSILSEETIELWKTYGITLLLLGSLTLGYGIYVFLKKKHVSLLFGFLALFCYIPFIYMYGLDVQNIFPSSIPTWMIPEKVLLYVGTFLMPTLVYALLVLVAKFTTKRKKHKAWMNFLFAIATPIIWYFFLQVILPLWQPVINDFDEHVLFISIISSTLFFLFFLIRGTFIIVSKKSDIWQRNQLVWKIPIAIIFPLTGLLFNSVNFFSEYTSGREWGIFGNFNGLWFYLLALLNGIFICLPNHKNKVYRLTLIFARSITFPYILYFLLVFLPFLPLSILAILFIGVGFLMLSPLVLFILQVHQLSEDSHFLNTFYSKKIIWGTSILGFLFLPICITLNYTADKDTLNETLDYIYHPNYSKNYHLDKASLHNTLDIIRYNKGNNNAFDIFGCRQPYLSSYYNWLVMNNLTVSKSKINTIECIFEGERKITEKPDNFNSRTTEITKVTTQSNYDRTQDVWRSWINLEITNHSENSWRIEYSTDFELPPGTWISDYYLYIDNKKEMGILTEKKTAMWVFNNIQNKYKDPGILHYLTGNKIAFKVFPFDSNETRKTGIELIHKEPIQLIIGKKRIHLGKENVPAKIEFENENLAYISSLKKKSLRKIHRKPYFHFIVDATKKKNVAKFVNRIKNLTKEYKHLTQNAKISYTNTYVTTHLLDNNWTKDIRKQDFKGGFYLDRAIKSVLFDSYQSNTDSFPVIVVVTDSINHAILDKDFSDWGFAFPDHQFFYNLKENDTLDVHSLIQSPSNVILDDGMIIPGNKVLEYHLGNGKTTYLPDDNQPSIVLKSDIFEVEPSKIKEKSWSSAITLQALWMSQILHPETTNKEWLNLVKCSFISKIMTPVTAYLVVENKAQKAMLKKKQEQVLSSNKALDLEQEIVRMTEPNMIIIGIILFFLILYRRKKKIRLNQ